MTDSSANATAVLTMVGHYIDTLLPTLNKVETDSTFSSTDHSLANKSKAYDEQDVTHKNAAKQSATNQEPSLLWVFQDQEALTTLQTQLPVSSENTALSMLHKLAMQSSSPRYQLACFWLPELSRDLLPQYIPLLMRYRDLYAARLIIALDNDLDLRAYGFTPLDLFDNERVAKTVSTQTTTESSPSLTLWQFNLYDYKKLPNWLNSDYWANPENWDKRRW